MEATGSTARGSARRGKPFRRELDSVNHRKVLLMVITGCLATSVGWAYRNVGGSRTVAFSREPTPTELSALDQAEKIRVSQCMQRHGIAYVVVPSVPAPLQRTFPYVIDDIVWAREYGLGEEAQSQLMRARAADPKGSTAA
jgi:hypothetical protein